MGREQDERDRDETSLASCDLVNHFEKVEQPEQDGEAHDRHGHQRARGDDDRDRQDERNEDDAPNKKRCFKVESKQMA